MSPQTAAQTRARNFRMNEFTSDHAQIIDLRNSPVNKSLSKALPHP